MTDQPHGFSDGIGAGGARGDRRHDCAAAVMPHRDHTGCHIADQHRNEQRGYTARSFFQQLAVLRFKCADSTDTAAKENRAAFRVYRSHDSAFFGCLLRCRCRELHAAVSSQYIVDLQVLPRVKILDLCRQLRFIVCRIEQRDRSDSVFSCLHAFPRGTRVMTDRAYRPHAGHDHSSVFHPLASFLLYMARPPSTRKTSPVT